MLTVSQLHEHADKIESEGIATDLTAAKGPDEIMAKVCEIYQKVRPFMEVIASLFFIPKKWRQAIQTFMIVLDGLCPAVTLPDL